MTPRFAEHDFAPSLRSAERGFTPPWLSAEHGFLPSCRSAEHGFTLVEMLVALLIFTLLASAGAALLVFGVRAQAASGATLDDVAALTRLSAALSADLAQAAPRATRDREGHELPVFIGEAGSSSAPMLRLVRRGWTNLDDAPRAGLQAVEYRLVDGRLQRVALPMLDGAAPLPASTLLDRVAAVTLRYRLAGAWLDRWRPSAGAPLPDAVDMVVTRRDGRAYRQLFLAGTGYAPPLAERGQ